MVSWFIYDGAIRVHAVNAVGRRKGRIIEVEVVDTGERFHGSARRLERLVQTIGRSGGETDPSQVNSEWLGPAYADPHCAGPPPHGL
jgi:hypothetical protein